MDFNVGCGHKLKSAQFQTVQTKKVQWATIMPRLEVVFGPKVQAYAPQCGLDRALWDG